MYKKAHELLLPATPSQLQIEFSSRSDFVDWLQMNVNVLLPQMQTSDKYANFKIITKK
jgi:hypothetical protein